MEPTERPMQSAQINELAAALSSMQATDLFASKDSTNPFFNSKYADLTSVLRTIRIPLTTNGLAISQTTEPYPDGVTVVTTLMHKSGQWIRGRLSQEIIPDKKNRRTPQALLSLITYLRRAGASAITGLGTEDDDGESVSGRDTLNVAPTPKVPEVSIDISEIHEMPSDKKLLPIEFPCDLCDYPIESQYPITVKQMDGKKTHWIINGADVFTDGNGHYFTNAAGFTNPPKCVHAAVIDAMFKFGADDVMKEYPNISMFEGE